ncbi:TPA: terminase small subunit [Pasteurella multocida]|uniref:terminase small subunit n=1 Tax=Pasteurella multocida TaxID=747 RepID=UPI0028DFA0B5|nr:terminase small subunit [Pasteurella multocida]MEB3485163.1 terminase small subunit [Pasteurella multocida]MEB3494545.1 terminase small subunit [Pasteurella multocida]MEB3504156.1 terminase small subunit [Pasteurella multocida]HDR0968098.1 terminase small subunit [Pasteurella multocida]HDR0969227.1 terminase small subunit [Pasteurella multocida]
MYTKQVFKKGFTYAKKDEVESTSKGRGLTPKQEKFCQLYIELGNASEAYRQAYDCSKMSNEAVNVEAIKLLNNPKNPKITLRVEELKKLHQERHNLTVDKVIRDLEEYRDICMGRKPLRLTTVVKNNQEGTAQSVDTDCFVFEPAGANKALELLGKHLGMFSQKVEVSGDLQIEHKTELDLSGLNFEELEQLEKLLAKSNTESHSN